MKKTFIILAVLFVASVARAQVSGGASADVVKKIEARLRLFDTNGNGVIEQDEADKGGAATYMQIRCFGPAGKDPHYPISINDLLQMAGGGAVPASTTGTPTAQQPVSGGVATAATSSSQTAAASLTTTGGTTTAPRPVLSQSPAVSSVPTSTVSLPITPIHRSGRPATAKERLQSRGLPDWFLQKMDAAGQITMAEYSNTWTEATVKDFQKYDLNRDGIITADEVLKVEGHRGGK